MSPSFVNQNPHGIRVRNDEGQLVRLVPQQVLDADGGFADRLQNTAGVETASDDDRRTWESIARTPDPPGLYRRDQVAAAAEARTQARRIAVVGPLQRVIGDDSAPYGPPTGTITTKQAVVEGEPAGSPDRLAYADHEAVVPVEGAGTADVLNPTVIPTEPEVHNTQNENFVAAGAAAELLETGSGSDGDPEQGDGGGDGGGEPTPESVPAPEEETPTTTSRRRKASDSES